MDWTPDEIRKRRDAAGLSQEELGQALGAHLGKPVSRRAITNWETGVATPHGRNIRALDRVLGDQPTSYDPPLSQANFLELVAELTRRYAHATQGTERRDVVDPPGHYKIFTADIPSPEQAHPVEEDATKRDEAGS